MCFLEILYFNKGQKCLKLKKFGAYIRCYVIFYTVDSFYRPKCITATIMINQITNLIDKLMSFNCTSYFPILTYRSQNDVL